jgi:hypothetical protein
MNDIPKVVFSRTLERAPWPDSRIARKDVAAPLRLALVDAKTYTTGAALHVYRPEG